ncbi:tRNA 5-methylaminomethyl-2-thiouridine synthase tusD [Vibrio ishigakensis]|uniref:Sulfurtransferase TusD homolog n=1 Tax=Vibrio ishigakensis TaxID=1481914 RepID=A0A0B8QQB3_9VIBR|nr:tRNA 5-methylaminomethyl-2-thiouridine synthase tusD [Vibrio ishigakensis]
MSLTYTLVVNGNVYGEQGPLNAYQFSQALIKKGHRLVSVFFYQQGVSNGNGLTVPANDEFDLVAAWQQLAAEHGVQLQTCVAAALRRGVVGEEEAKLNQLSRTNLADGFEQSGLGSLAEALLTQDRVVQF